MCKTAALMVLMSLIALHGRTNGSLNTVSNPTGFSDLIKAHFNKTNFEKSKEIIEAYFDKMEVIDYKLPESIVPKKYVIGLVPDIKNLTFDGDVKIYGQASDYIQNRNIITLHADTLNISDVQLVDLTDGTDLTVVSSVMLDKLQRFVITLSEELNPDTEYELSMKFSGKIRDGHGLFLSTYPGKPESPLLATEFQSTYARNAFPCWDEPKYKASFTIRIAREPNLVALANMPLNFTSDPDENFDGKVWDTFEESPSMSTYLVALAVGDLRALKDEENNISIWTEPGKEELTRFALNFTKATIDKLEEFTGVEYWLPKLDQLATPYLCFEAMENWGLITYVDSHLLIEDEESESEKKDVAMHISHEVAHQWFGNLVTFEWWNSVWLNEGFAQFLQYLIVDSLEPDWRAMEKFVVTDLQYILGKDAYTHTHHPLSAKFTETSDDISSMFDNISYLKGGSIVRMLYHITTPELFRKAIKRYLQVNALKSVTDEILWENFREIDLSELDLPVDIEDLMDSWIHEKGYPVIEMERAENETVSIHSITLKQECFLKDQKFAKLSSMSDNKWWIPLSYTTSTESNFDDTKTKEWFNPESDEHELNIYLEEDEWIILNIQVTGFYRVNYDLLTWNLIVDDMIDNGFNDIHPLNRAALIDDSYNLALTGHVDIDVFMNLTRYLVRETDMIPWTTAFSVFNDLSGSLAGTPALPLFNRYVQWLTSCWHAEIGFTENDNDTAATKLSRTLLLDVACTFEHRECQDKALEHVYLMMSEADVRLPTNLEEMHLCVAVAQGSNEVWQYVRKRYLETAGRGRLLSLLDAMACTTDSSILKQMLKDSVDEHSFLPQQHRNYLIFSLLSEMNVKDIDLVLDFFIENLEELLHLYGETKVTSYFLVLAQKLNKNSTKMYKFIENHEIELKQILPSLKSKLKYVGDNLLKDEYYEKIYEWLKREEVNFERANTDDYEVTDGDDLEETTTADEDIIDTFTEEVNEFSTTEDNIDAESTTTEISQRNIFSEIKNNITDIIDEGIHGVIESGTDIIDDSINNVIESATEIINKKMIPKIHIKDSTNSISSGSSCTRMNFLTFYVKILFLYSFAIVIF